MGGGDVGHREELRECTEQGDDDGMRPACMSHYHLGVHVKLPEWTKSDSLSDCLGCDHHTHSDPARKT